MLGIDCYDAFNADETDVFYSLEVVILMHFWVKTFNKTTCYILHHTSIELYYRSVALATHCYVFFFQTRYQPQTTYAIFLVQGV
jgi:hypothetical protein